MFNTEQNNKNPGIYRVSICLNTSLIDIAKGRSASGTRGPMRGIPPVKQSISVQTKMHARIFK